MSSLDVGGLCVAGVLASLAGAAPAHAQDPLAEPSPDDLVISPPAQGRESQITPEKYGLTPPERREPVITPHEVLRRTPQEEISKLFPEAAVRAGVSGKVTVQCRIGLSTLLEDCVVTREDPAGYGYGEATLAMLRGYRVRPPSIDGVPTDRQKINFPMTWTVTRPPPSPAPEAGKVIEWDLKTNPAQPAPPSKGRPRMSAEDYEFFQRNFPGETVTLPDGTRFDVPDLPPGAAPRAQPRPSNVRAPGALWAPSLFAIATLLAMLLSFVPRRRRKPRPAGQLYA